MINLQNFADKLPMLRWTECPRRRNFVDSSSCHYHAPVGEHRALVVRVQGRGGALLAAEGEAALVAHHGRGGVQQGEAGEAARHGVLNTGRWRTIVTAE